MNEAEIIARFFTQIGARRADVSTGIGDDAAVLAVPAGKELVATTDTLVEGRHFLPGAAPHSLGHRALAVNLSDIAAMGAQPAWALLSLVMPVADEAWLAEFAAGFSALALQHQVALVGGNLTRGPLSITVQLLGQVARGRAVLRSGARAGELLCLTGSVGDAAAALAIRMGTLAVIDSAALCRRFDYPAPRVALGAQLGGIASACIDISDGVYVDLARLAERSGCGARLMVEKLPVSVALRQALGENAWEYALRGGEDYELGLAVPAPQLAALQTLARNCDTALTVVGELATGSGLHCLHHGRILALPVSGFDHFDEGLPG